MPAAEPKGLKDMPDEGYPLAGSAAILCTGGPDMIRREAWPFYRSIFGVRLCWELEEPQAPTKSNHWVEYEGLVPPPQKRVVT